MVPGLAGSRVNEVGSMYPGVPGSGTPAEVALDNGFADAGPLVPFGRIVRLLSPGNKQSLMNMLLLVVAL